MFREHVAAGGLVSVGVAAAAYSYEAITDPVLLGILVVITIVGSFLPDVDSDSGMPFYFVFGSATIVATGVVAIYTLASPYATDWRYLLGIPAAAFFFFWVVVGALVKKCTKHRGMFHSLPALLIASIATYLIAREYGFSDVAYVFAIGMGLGFLTHLVLDELHSDITLDGIPFNVKESSGTAMKWFSRRRGVNVATYAILATLVYCAWPAQQVLAFYNDSDVIEVENDAPPAPPEDSGGSGGGGGGTGSGAGFGGVANQSTGETTQGSSNSGDTQTPSETTVSANPSSSSGSLNTVSEDALLDSLISEGIITGSGAVSGSLLLDEAGVQGSGMITVDGDAVRRYFRGKFDLQDVLLGWRAGVEARLSARGLGYIAASTALTDRNVGSISFSADSFGITYRSRGYLFSVIPISFPVRITVIPEAEAGRVSVKLPWYRLFVREFFTPRGLAEDIDAVLLATIEKNAAQTTDLRPVLFTAVVEYLRTKIGTVGDTVRAE